MFANIVSMFATRFVAFRLIISNSIPDEGWEVDWKRILEVEQRCFQSLYHLSICGKLIYALDEMIDLRTEFSN